MFSVTQRIKQISQPKGGFVPKTLFVRTIYDDMNEIHSFNYNNKSLYSIQGMAVDYLTRFLITNNKSKAFNISILGAQIIDKNNNNNNESIHISNLLSKVNGLDDLSIINACKIVGYDTVYRSGVNTFHDVEEIIIPHEMIINIRCMVKRSIIFLNAVGPITSIDLRFEGGYTELVSKGDGDYLTNDMLIDFKVSKKEFSIDWSLQLLMYYILGLHSIYNEYRDIKYLCVFNPLYNESYIVYIPAIDNKSKYIVSNNILGYSMKNKSKSVDKNDTYLTWDKVNGSDPIALPYAINNYINNINFNAYEYPDGIHNISVEEYWSYIRQTDKQYEFKFIPKFSFTDYVIMLKKNGYLMFFSVSPKGTLSILNGGKYKKTNFSINYYYDKIDKYAELIVNRFSKYWDVLGEISNQLKELEPSQNELKTLYLKNKIDAENYGLQFFTFNQWYSEKKYKLSGHIHGCIVDIDYNNHIYLNPYDGSLVPYYATSKYDKIIYKNIKSLIAAKRPEMLNPFNKLKQSNPKSLLVVDKKTIKKELVTQNSKIDDTLIKEYSNDMYKTSNLLKSLQKIYDLKLVSIWNDMILTDDIKDIDDKYKLRKTKSNKYIGQKIKQKSGNIATVINYRCYEDVDVQFDDGYIVENVSIQSWKKGTIIHYNRK